MKKCLLFLCLCTLCSFRAFSQVYYLVDTAMTTDTGYDGAAASCIFTGGSTYGWAMNRAAHVWLADAFTIPADTVWAFDTVIVYGYQIGEPSTTSTFLDCNLQIYDGAPGLGGSVIWGDTVTNVLVSSAWTGIYRVDTNSSAGGLDQTTRPVMYLKLGLSPAPHLGPGTYWLSWSAAGTLSSSSSPEKVLPGRINPPGQQARQLNPDGIWDFIVDNGNDIGLNKIIKASAAVAAVPAIPGKPSVALCQNSPNPFTDATTISFYLPQPGYAKLDVYNAAGQLVATLADGNTEAGWHNAACNAAGLPAGIYAYRLSTDAGVTGRQMLIVK